MKQHLFGFVGLSLAVALAAGCKSNPQASIDQVAAAINVSSSYLVIDVGDSIRVDAQVVDAQGTPLTTLPDASSNDPTVVSLSTIDPYPVPETSFWAKAKSFGDGSITVTSGNLTATINVRTIPHGAAVGGLAATIASGDTAQLTPIGLDVNGDTIAVPADSFTWSTSDATILAVNATGLVTAKAPGTAVITVTPPGGKGAGLGPAEVVPGTFAGTFSTTTPNTIQLVTATKTAGAPVFDTTTTVTVGGSRAFIDNIAPDGSTITFAVPFQLAPGSKADVVFAGLGPDEVALAQTAALTINATGVDPSAPADTSPATAPTITADGNYYVLLTDSDPAQYAGLVGGVANFFTVTAGATDLNLKISMDWDAPALDAGDMDFYLCANSCSAGGDFGADGFGAASSNKPEHESLTVPAGTTMHFMMVRYAPGIPAGDLVQLHVTGF